jgi:leucyl aminopeptidase
MLYTKLGYPAGFASDDDPLAGDFPGDFDPYIHGVNDTMDVDDTGYFTLDASLILMFFLGCC